MAIIRKKINELGSGRVDREKVLATTEEEIQQHRIEDGMAGFEFSENARFVVNVDVRALRERLGLTQEEFAQRYRLPLRSLQEWEQWRKRPAPGTMTLLLAISRNPKALAKALA